MPNSIEQNLITELFDYVDGNLYWKIDSSQRIKKGSLAGTIRPPQNYRVIGIKGKYYYAHRLVFLYHYGYMPKIIDHKDGNVTNNRIENLRPCNQSENITNSSISINNKSGYKGVSWYNSNQRWCGKITINGKPKRKFFKDKEKAKEWLCEMRKIYHGEFINNG